MQVYENYKDSGIEWIGKIPAHWEVKKLKRLAKICNGQDHKKVWDENGSYPIIGSGGIFGRAKDYLFKGPSVLLGRKGTIDKPQYISSPFWSVDTAYYTEIFKEISPRLFYYLCKTINFDLYKYGSTVPSMTQETLNQIPFAISNNIEEQTTIANYLDQKTAELDTLIADKQELLKLYEEEKTAIINQAVTKGINPNVTLKDSGIAWLGEIPEHWEVYKLKYILSEKLMYGANEPAKEENIEHPRYIRITDFGKDGELKSDTYKSLPPKIAEDYLLENGDILFARSGATVGKTFQFKNYKKPACFAGYLIKASLDSTKAISDFIYFFTKSNSYENWKNSIFNQATIQNIGADKYAMLELALPQKINEQQEIVDYIEEQLAIINAKQKKTTTLIKLLTEYRTALISEVVTGKIKVPQ
ncbi:restriction endonuclease subunit S [Tenacibaculum amylolyticum]|uniref:restriction endonuclease subunit S n=1 Tax=Tenacibaculum amylolyticum TaxID=104269 RepID=UPI0038952BA9